MSYGTLKGLSYSVLQNYDVLGSEEYANVAVVYFQTFNIEDKKIAFMYMCVHFNKVPNVLMIGISIENITEYPNKSWALMNGKTITSSFLPIFF